MAGHATTRPEQHPTIHQPDITLTLDDAGVIRKASLANDLPAEGMEAWLGRQWSETVGAGGSDKVRGMVDDALHRGVSAFRLVTQRFPNGMELPVEYSTVRLGGKSGLLAIGKNQQAVADLQGKLIATQQAREQDYWKLREVETRYRLLFDTSHEAVLLIRADNLRVVEANIAALRALNLVQGQDLLPEIPASEATAFQTMLTRVRDQGRAPGVVLHLGPQRDAWLIRASLMSSDPGQLFMLQLAPAGAPGVAAAPSSTAMRVQIEALIECLPDAFVIVDQDGSVLHANAAFLDLVQVGSEGMVVGASLGRWLQSPGADLAVLLATLQRHRTVRLLATRLQSENGDELNVEISAASSQDGTRQLIAVVLRDVSRRAMTATPTGSATSPHGPLAGVQAAIDAMESQIGQLPLPQMVRDMIEVMERHFIEAALERSAGNRTIAAEMLGLSRQSLYVKLKKYELAPDGQPEVEASI